MKGCDGVCVYVRVVYGRGDGNGRFKMAKSGLEHEETKVVVTKGHQGMVSSTIQRKDKLTCTSVLL